MTYFCVTVGPARVFQIQNADLVLGIAFLGRLEHHCGAIDSSIRDFDEFLCVQDLAIGDIIVFNRPEGGDRVIVHRIVDIDLDADGERIVRTRGDANPGSIPGTDYPIRQDDYIGKVIYVIPGIGVITKVISPPVNYIIIAIILAILFFSRLNKKNSNSNNKDASPAAAGNSDKPPT